MNARTESHYFKAGQYLAMAAMAYTNFGCLHYKFENGDIGPVSTRWRDLDALPLDITLCTDVYVHERARQIWGSVAVALYRSGGNPIDIEDLTDQVWEHRKTRGVDFLFGDWWWGAREAQTTLLDNWGVIQEWVHALASGHPPEVWEELHICFELPKDRSEVPDSLRRHLKEQYSII